MSSTRGQPATSYTGSGRDRGRGRGERVASPCSFIFFQLRQGHDLNPEVWNKSGKATDHEQQGMI